MKVKIVTNLKQLNQEINITEPALAHLTQLVVAEQLNSKLKLNLRLKVLSKARNKQLLREVDISFCPAGQQAVTDFVKNCGEFELYVEDSSIMFITGAKIAYEAEPEEQIVISGPGLKPVDLSDYATAAGSAIGARAVSATNYATENNATNHDAADNATNTTLSHELNIDPSAYTPEIEQQLTHSLQNFITEIINPMLAQHSGYISLHSVDWPQGLVYLNFGGGCHGCGMAGVTLKSGIEQQLKASFPMLKDVIDMTDHRTGANPYY